MLRLLFIVSALVVVSLIICNTLELRAYLAYRRALATAQFPSAVNGQEARPLRAGVSAFLKLPRAQQAQALSLAHFAGAMSWARQESHLHVVSLLSQMLEETTDAANRLRLYCESLSQLGQALKKDKLNARLMIRWANLRQLLSDFECEERFTQGNYHSVVAEALLLSPSDMQVKYAAGLILLWAGEKTAAYQLFKEVLSLATYLAPPQENFIFSKVSDAESLRALVPARFPQIERFSHYLKAGSALPVGDAEREELNRELSLLQIDAIQASSVDFESGRLPWEVHFKHLVSLLPVVADERARRELDTELSRLSAKRGQDGLSRYLMERSRLQELKIIACQSAGDTRALKSSLANWGLKQTIFIDEFFCSLGFYLGPGQTPRLIELHSAKERGTHARLPLKILYSDDNQKWSEAPQPLQPEQFDLPPGTIVVLRPPAEYHKYWKVHYAGAARERTFGLELGSGLKVYGRSTESRWGGK